MASDDNDGREEEAVQSGSDDKKGGACWTMNDDGDEIFCGLRAGLETRTAVDGRRIEILGSVGRRERKEGANAARRGMARRSEQKRAASSIKGSEGGIAMAMYAIAPLH